MALSKEVVNNQINLATEKLEARKSLLKERKVEEAKQSKMQYHNAKKKD